MLGSEAVSAHQGRSSSSPSLANSYFHPLRGGTEENRTHAVEVPSPPNLFQNPFVHTLKAKTRLVSVAVADAMIGGHTYRHGGIGGLLPVLSSRHSFILPAQSAEPSSIAVARSRHR